MKIRKLRFKNINSLAGTWEIDFEHPAFNDGLFALTGPTGAGKTTILDAICLGLYGKTARQNKISNTENEVMTRGTGDSFAEVEFELRGRQYRSYWEQHRERGKPQGKLQNPSRKIAVLPEERFIAEKLKDCDEKIIELLGMDFLQFTRSVLLAQGQFDAFLKAKGSERSAILEQITGTEIYSRIGTAIFKRWQEEKEKKEHLSNLVEFSKPIPYDERARLEESLKQIECEKKELGEQIESLRRQIQWLENIEKLKKELSKLNSEKGNILNAHKNAVEDFKKLDRAIEARKFDGLMQKIESLSNAKKETEKELEKRRQNLQKIELEIACVKPESEKATENSKKAVDELEKMLPLIEKARVKDAEIKTAKAELAAAEKAFNEAVKTVQEFEAEFKKIIENMLNAESELKTAEAYLNSNSTDEKLKEILPSLESYLGIWNGKKNELVKMQRNIKNAEKEFAEAEKLLDEIQKELEKAKKANSANLAEKEKAEKSKEEAEKALADARPDIETKIRLAHEKVLLTETVANLEKQRMLLEDGKPCPLCGSVEHPYAKGKIPKISAAKKELEAFQDELKKLENAEKAARKAWEKRETDCRKSLAALDEQKTAWQNALNQTNAAKNAFQNYSEGLKNLSEECDKIWKTISSKLSETGILPDQQTLAENILKLKERHSRFDDMKKKFSDLKIIISTAKENREECLKKLESAKFAKDTKENDLKNKRQICYALNKERQELLDGDADKIEKSLREQCEKAIKLANEFERQMEKLFTGRENEAREIERMGQLLEARIQEHKSCVESSRTLFAKAGFSDENHCREARWNDEDMEKVSKFKNELAQKLERTDAVLGKLLEDLKIESEKKLTERQIEEIRSELEQTVSAIENKDKCLMDLKAKLKADDDMTEKCASNRAELNKQLAVFEKWNRMNSWAGGANGENFKRYAQGITLNNLLKAANVQLLKMTGGRYELICKEDDEKLLPEAIDHHQGNIERPISNFSGGETFMVSLALALGLSRIASGRLKIDSLFLDEGFGTLDNQSLDIAINTLAELHHSEGKLIGVISHIEQMKNQIATRIEVNKIGGGRSEISGAGVSKKFDMNEELSVKTKVTGMAFSMKKPQNEPVSSKVNIH